MKWAQVVCVEGRSKGEIFEGTFENHPAEGFEFILRRSLEFQLRTTPVVRVQGPNFWTKNSHYKILREDHA